MTITQEDAKAQAKALRVSLSAQDIEIKHTQAIDLVCASHGLRSRSLLGNTAMTSSRRPNISRIVPIATALALHDEEQRRRIVGSTTDATHPNGLRVDVDTGSVTESVRIPYHALPTPKSFATSEPMAKVIDSLADDFAYYKYFDGSNSPIERAACNEMAWTMLQSIDEGEDPLIGLEDYFEHGDTATDFVERDGSQNIKDVAEAIVEAAEEAVPGIEADADRWYEAIRTAVANKLEDDDDTQVTDMIGSADRAELVFVLGEVGGMEDDMLASHKPWSDPAEMQVTNSLLFALSRLGYGLTEFRKLSGNRHKPNLRDANSRHRPRRTKVADWKAVSEIITEACTSYFNVVLYGYVPLHDLAKLRQGVDLELTGFHLASYNCMSGTFYDSTRIERVTMSTDDGYLRSCHGWHTPDSICGLVMSSFEANIKAAPGKPTRKKSASREA